MTIYYVNSATGSDRNAGTNQNSAFATLSKVESLALKPGDSVLLAKGSVFNEQFDIKYSGSESAPIKIGSYGTGAAPVIHSGGDGIHSLYASNIVIENLKITNSGGSAISGGSVSNWTVRHVEVDKAGLSREVGSVNFRNSRDITIENSKISAGKGDGFWIEKVEGVKLLNNTVTNSHGATADAVQVNDSSNIVIRGNHLDQTHADSPKGVIVLIRPVNAVVEDNTLSGGGFGISAQAGKNVAIHDNDISGFHGYDWSFAIGLGDQGNTRDYDISGNHIHDGAWGVVITDPADSASYIRTNIQVHDNVFDDLTQAALKVDRPASGSFYNNTIESGVEATSISPAIADAHTFSVSNNHTVTSVETVLASSDARSAAMTDANVDPAVVAVHDNLKIITDTGDAHHGNLLKNDSSDNGTLALRRFGDQSVGKHGLTLTGEYGVIHVDREGNYAYTLDETKLSDHGGHVSESFSYGINDGTSHHSDGDTLTVFVHLDGLLS
ncbi:right-handed parallel beta-helix repeat-containing protein [Rhizobium sp. NLR22b]|uniref:right-handed parallel beta-helix repeat-containing protein n=1 Tax=Rhizobium sp. NLR22b TaxID=2731115 RepID=UPI001C83E59C|nr:right-handed parallel beta-helix repeat-containing protein [Rhizobium sp. NLR22b]MBX5239289.1 right-handed parallel beta-helix repeat-containing protein [Rhizobium sp. NLR22b]